MIRYDTLCYATLYVMIGNISIYCYNLVNLPYIRMIMPVAYCLFTLERRLLGLLGGVSQKSDKVIYKLNGKQTGPYLVSCVSIIFINFFSIKKG